MDEWYEPCCSEEDKELDSWYEPGCLEEYKYILQLGKDYAQWFEKFTLTHRGNTIVGWYNRDWRKMHDELVDFFHREMMMKSYDEEDDPLIKIDVSQRDNFKWQFHAWMAGVKDTCPNPKLYFGRYYGIDEYFRYKRFFFKHHWDPKKTVDESLIKKLKKEYNFDYNAM